MCVSHAFLHPPVQESQERERSLRSELDSARQTTQAALQSQQQLQQQVAQLQQQLLQQQQQQQWQQGPGSSTSEDDHYHRSHRRRQHVADPAGCKCMGQYAASTGGVQQADEQTMTAPILPGQAGTEPSRPVLLSGAQQPLESRPAQEAPPPLPPPPPPPQQQQPGIPVAEFAQVCALCALPGIPYSWFMAFLKGIFSIVPPYYVARFLPLWLHTVLLAT